MNNLINLKIPLIIRGFFLLSFVVIIALWYSIFYLNIYLYILWLVTSLGILTYSVAFSKKISIRYCLAFGVIIYELCSGGMRMSGEADIILRNQDLNVLYFDQVMFSKVSALSMACVGILLFPSSTHVRKSTIAFSKIPSDDRLVAYCGFAIGLALSLIGLGRTNINTLGSVYELGEGFSMIFAGSYIIGVSGIALLLHKKTHTSVVVICISALMVSLLGFLGIRQILLWLFLAYFVAASHSKNYNFRIWYFISRCIFPLVVLMVLFSLILIYRSSEMNISSMDLTGILHGIWLGVGYETTLTQMSTYQALSISGTENDFFPFYGLLDGFKILAPSIFFDDRNLAIVKLREEGLCAAYGTYFTTAECILNARYLPLVVVFYGFIRFISWVTERNFILCAYGSINISLYSFIVVFLGLGAVRNTLVGSIKIIFYMILIFYCLKKVIRLLRKPPETL